MYRLENEHLAVSVLDPTADRERLGSRYCTGGYILQIKDHKLGDLLSGPTYPDSFNVFDGQGIPDGFALAPLRETVSADPATLILGIGTCNLQNGKVLEFCRWDVDHSPRSVRMVTEHVFGSYAARMERTVTLTERTVRSETHIENTGQASMPIRWFPHPFFPHPHTDELFKVNFPVSFPENPGYEIGANGYIRRKSWTWGSVQSAKLDHAGDSRLIVFQRHPKVGLIAATCSYVPGFFLIWGNQHTFSWEPFLERSVWSGQSYAWSIDYEF